MNKPIATCNCIGVSNYHKIKITKIAEKNGYGRYLPTEVIEDDCCKFCGHYVYYTKKENLK